MKANSSESPPLIISPQLRKMSRRAAPDMIRGMSLRKAVLLTVLPWAAGISLLHAGLNLDLFRKVARAEKSFKVGFLPVT